MAVSIWVVEQGQYSDYRVVGVFSTEANARAVASLVPASSVAEWPLDPAVSELAQGHRPFDVWMLRDGTVEKCELQTSLYDIATGETTLTRPTAHVAPRIYATVWAKDDVHAIKIINEARTRMIAENEWPEQEQG